MSQKIKAPNSQGGSGFVWTIVAIVAIAAVAIGAFVWNNSRNSDIAAEMPQESVDFAVSVDDNSVVLASKNVKKDAPVVEIFEDFSCPHCSDLAVADHEDVLKALNDGELTVKYRFLNFLDNGQVGSSTRGAAVGLAVAETGDAQAFWNMHSYMMSEQREVARTWDYSELAEAAGAYDLDQSVIDSISNGEVEQAGKDLAKANEDELTKRVGKVSSPVVFADGKEVEIKGGPDGKPLSWVPDVVK
ncbi:DsbA family protein [Corynebacterium urogenitale]